jgi:signal-transduction protein with cAMP-binding, CBS, and nucleotidyltransferase domain
MTELIEFINSYVELDSETEQAILDYFKTEVYEKNDFILEEGKICSKVSFIKSGLVRRFYLDDGMEITNWMYSDNQWLTSMTSFFDQKPSFENFQACEKTILYSLSYAYEQRLLEYPLFSKFHIKLLRQYLASLNEFHHKYKLMNANQKYSYLLTYFPEIIKKAKLKHIASLIDVSQATLSRIRATIY